MSFTGDSVCHTTMVSARRPHGPQTSSRYAYQLGDGQMLAGVSGPYALTFGPDDDRNARLAWPYVEWCG